MTAIKQEYVPGVCNIGPVEIAQRRLFGWIGVVLTALLWAIFAVFGVAAPWRLFLFLPSGMAATGFLQAALHLCAGFGMRGVFNFGPEVGKTDNVMQAEFRRKDRARALGIMGWSALVGLVVALVGFFTAL